MSVWFQSLHCSELVTHLEWLLYEFPITQSVLLSNVFSPRYNYSIDPVFLISKANQCSVTFV